MRLRDAAPLPSCDIHPDIAYDGVMFGVMNKDWHYLINSILNDGVLPSDE